MTDASDGPQVDYRFTLANERTFLAWVRTSLAFVAGGIAVSELLSGSRALREVLALALIGCGALGALLAYRRWMSVETTMRRGGPLPSSPLPRFVALVVVAVAAVAVVLVVSVLS